MFKGNINRANPEAYTRNGLKVFMTNICVTGDTLIDIKIGEEIHKIRIDEVGQLLDLEPEIYVLSKNIKENQDEWKLITDWGLTDESAEVFEIEDSITGKMIQCTGNHKLLTNKGWVEAKDLTEDDCLVIK
jgi:intein/homing endonuclease